MLHSVDVTHEHNSIADLTPSHHYSKNRRDLCVTFHCGKHSYCNNHCEVRFMNSQLSLFFQRHTVISQDTSFLYIPYDTCRNGLVSVQQILIPPNLLSSITAQCVLYLASVVHVCESWVLSKWDVSALENVESLMTLKFWTAHQLLLLWHISTKVIIKCTDKKWTTTLRLWTST